MWVPQAQVLQGPLCSREGIACCPALPMCIEPGWSCIVSSYFKLGLRALNVKCLYVLYCLIDWISKWQILLLPPRLHWPHPLNIKVTSDPDRGYKVYKRTYKKHRKFACQSYKIARGLFFGISSSWLHFQSLVRPARFHRMNISNTDKYSVSAVKECSCRVYEKRLATWANMNSCLSFLRHVLCKQSWSWRVQIHPTGPLSTYTQTYIHSISPLTQVHTHTHTYMQNQTCLCMHSINKHTRAHKPQKCCCVAVALQLLL